jgi:hypothetical protein
MGYLQSEESKSDGTETSSGLVGGTGELGDGRSRSTSGGAVAGGSGHGRDGGGGLAGLSDGGLDGSRGLDDGGGGLSGGGRGGRGNRGGGGGNGGLYGNIDIDTGGLAGLGNGVDGSLLVLGIASLLDAGNDGSEEGVGLLAMAVEVVKSSTAIGAQGTEEAAQSAGGDVLKLSGANSGEGGNGDGNIGLHFDD